VPPLAPASGWLGFSSSEPQALKLISELAAIDNNNLTVEMRRAV